MQMKKIIVACALAAGVSFAAAGTTNAAPPCDGESIGFAINFVRPFLPEGPLAGPNSPWVWGAKSPGQAQKLCTPGNQG